MKHELSRTLIEAAECERTAHRSRFWGLVARRIFSRLCLLSVLAASPAFADTSYVADLAAVQTSEALVPRPGHSNAPWWREFSPAGFPHAAIEGEGEAYLECHGSAGISAHLPPCPQPTVLIRRAGDGEIRGTAVVEESNGFRLTTFTVPASMADPNGRRAFLKARLAYFEFLARARISGGALFRHEADLTRVALKGGEPGSLSGSMAGSGGFRPTPAAPVPSSSLDDSFELFTGARALSENLQLDRSLLLPTDVGEQTVPLETIAGISTPAFDWKPLLGSRAAELDQLAAFVPADHYGAFFPSFSSLEATMDEANVALGEAVRGFESRSEAADVRARYQEQLCLPLGELGRAVGEQLVTEVAITGSDPWFRAGTDLAVLLRSSRPELLLAAVRARQDACGAAAQNGTVADGTANGLGFHSVVTDDRSRSSYVARIGDVIVVTNSRPELEVLHALQTHGARTLGDLDEYRFFRTRYPHGAAKEAAFLVLPDAAIRKWVGPRWRIAESRRMRAAAGLSELQVRHAAEILGASAERTLTERDIPAGLGGVTLGPGGIRSSIYGTTAFLTPISELPLDRVTENEKRAYERFRTSYAAYWKTYFDPAAIQVLRSGSDLTVDATVMPLIAGTEYQPLRELTQGAALDELSGDPHDDALVDFTVALNTAIPEFQQRTAWMGMFLGGIANPLGWIGKSASIYFDADGIWKELAASNEPERDAERLESRLPAGLFIEVRDSLKLTAFLTSLRVAAERSTPGLSTWQNLEYHGVPYVKVSEASTTALKPVRAEERPPWAVYYAATPEALILTLNEPLLQRAIDRLKQRSASSDALARQFGKGQQAKLIVTKKSIDLLELFTSESYDRLLRDRCYSNLPVLNEWKRQFPDRDPVEVQRRILGTTPVCQAGGEYTWNAASRTMESTVLGHPGAMNAVQRRVPFFADANAVRAALGFEHDGLRAIVTIERSSRDKAPETTPTP